MTTSSFRTSARVSVIRAFAVLAFVLFTYSVSSAQPGLRWVRGTGSIPAGSIIGGEETDGTPIFICRTNHQGTILPGKVVSGKCNYNWGSTEYSSGSYDILVGTGGYWTDSVNPSTAISGGSGGGQNYYVCKAFTANGTHPGRIQDGKCNYGYGGKGYASTRFQVLNGSGTAAAVVSLLDAAASGDAANIRKALRAGERIDQKNTKGQTALMIAASKRASDAVRVLLNEGAAVEARDNEGLTALSYAAFAGDAQSVRQMLRAGASASSRTTSGYTPAWYAAAGGDVESLQAILSDPSYRGVEGVGLPLHGAASYNRANIIDFLVESEDVNVDQTDSTGQTAAMVASRGNKAAALSALIRAGADLSIRTANNWEVFGLAAVNNSTDALGVLLNSGKFPVKSTVVEAGLRVAARDSKIPALQYLLQRGVDPDAVQKGVGNTPMMMAAGNGHDDVIKTLLNARASVDLQNAKGETALIIAASAGKKDAVKVLLRAGADRSIADNNGRTALDYATQNGHGDTRKELEKGN